MESKSGNSWSSHKLPVPQSIFLDFHRKDWADAFANESALIAAALGSVLAAIHHIGSTAIPGIRAKPIIDMLAEVKDLAALDEVSDRMKALGYEVMGEFGISGRRYFRKDNAQGVRVHQVHAFQTGSPQIERHLAFRDYLRAHPDRAFEYDALKSKLAAQFPDDVSRYTDGKDDFIREIDSLAAKWRQTRA